MFTVVVREIVSYATCQIIQLTCDYPVQFTKLKSFYVLLDVNAHTVDLMGWK